MMDTETKMWAAVVILALCFLLAVPVGMTIHANHEDVAFAEVLKESNNHIETGCAWGRMAACDVIGRQR
jgi:hypothetical protein